MATESNSHFNLPIYEQAADWLIELREEEVDVAMRERLDAWFRASPAHIRAYLELSGLWEDGTDPDLDRAHSTDELIGLARSTSNVIPLNAGLDGSLGSANDLGAYARESSLESNSLGARSAQALIADRTSPETLAERRLGDVSSDPKIRRRTFSWRPALAAAAVVACVGVSASLYFYNQRNLTLVTDTGEQRFARLVDGSTVELNSRSRVRIRFSDHQRDVDMIEGQALFHVAKDASRPFVVHSGSTSVRAVGTQFDVYRKSSGTTVTVVEGRVAVQSPILEQISPVDSHSGSAVPPPAAAPGRSARAENIGSAVQASLLQTHVSSVPGDMALSNAGNAIFLSAGEQITVTSKAVATPTHTDPAVATAWIQHELVFDSTALSDVAQEFNRYNTRQLIISDAALRDFHITGVFSSADPASLLTFLRAQRDITVLETDVEVRVSKK